MSDILKSLEKSLSLTTLQKENTFNETRNNLVFESVILKSTTSSSMIDPESPSIYPISRQNSDISIETLQKTNDQSKEILNYLKQKEKKLILTIKTLQVIKN
jgi:hypothetical protein